MGPVHSDLDGLAAEIMCHIFAHLDIQAALNLARASFRLAQIFKKNWAAILLPILLRDFSPVETLLRLPDISHQDFPKPGIAWMKHSIYFNGRMICNGNNRGLFPSINYRQEHMKALIQVCKAVTAWEAVFPRLRFAQRTEFARTLRAHENERFRDALYNWWRYAALFHQDRYLPVSWTRDPQTGDLRCNYLRCFSTAQLYQLQDLWETIRSAVATHLCPSTVLVLRNGGASLSQNAVSRLGWGRPRENGLIVATVMRLLPVHMLQMLESRHIYATRQSFISAVRFLHPTIECGMESLSDALRWVINERSVLLRLEAGQRALKKRRYFPSRSFPKPQGGILDYHAQRWQKVRVKYSGDGGKGLGRPGEQGSVTYSMGHMAPGLLEPSQLSRYAS